MEIINVISMVADVEGGTDMASFSGDVWLYGRNSPEEDIEEFPFGLSRPSMLKRDEMTGNFKTVADAAEAWLQAGGTITPYVPPPIDEIRSEMEHLTARQFRLGLLHSGTTEAEVEAAIAGIEDPTERAIADIEWRTALGFDRLHPLVVTLGASLGYTPETIDSLWEYYLTI